MRRIEFMLALTLLVVAPWTAAAQSIWARRDQNAYLFYDTRARRAGDLITVVVDETTEFAGLDKKEMNKQTNATLGISASGKSTLGQIMSRTFSSEIDAAAKSQRDFEGKANNTIDRKLTDRMTAVVIAVLPNGNLVIEGQRRQLITHEARTLTVRGIVRPVDIGPYNMVLSQFVGELEVTYHGRGPESSYTNNGWLGKIVNKVWPF
jgi:flagellar L-ring protein FlgH